MPIIKIPKTKIIAIIGIMVACLLLFATALNTMSFFKLQADTYVHANILNTVSPVRQINYALSFGKPIDKYYGLDNVLEGIRETSPDVLGVAVLNQNDTMVETVGDMGTYDLNTRPDAEYAFRNEGIYVFQDFDGGQIVLRLDREPLNLSTLSCLKRQLSVDAVICAALMAILALAVLPVPEKDVPISRMKIMSLTLVICSQLALGSFFTWYVISSYEDSIRQIAETAAVTVEKDINDVIAKGMAYEELSGLEEYLSDLVGDIPEIHSPDISSERPTVPDWSVELNIGAAKDAVYLNCNYEHQLIQRTLVNNIIDVVILIMVSIFISLESSIFLSKHMEQKDSRKPGKMYMPGFRLFVFICGLAFTLDTGFISVLSSRLYEKMNLPESMSFLSGAPNTFYSIAVLIGLFGCSALISKLGMKRTLTLGVVAGILGYLMSAFAASLPVLILARFIFGFCDGFIINAMRLYAASQEDPELHTKLLVEYLAAINLGVCCSVVIGGLVADAISYSAVFLVGIALGLVCLALIGFVGFPNERISGSMSLVCAIRQLRNPRVLIFMLFVVVPIYMATLFVGYSFPLFGDEIGFSNSLVSGCLMINFLVIAYLTDIISGWIMKKVRPRPAVLGYMILQAASIGLFVLTASAWSAIAALILTSLWDCFGMVIIDTVLDDVKDTVTERNTLLQMIFGKVGMAIAPMAITSRIEYGAAKATGSIVLFLIFGFACYFILDLVFQRRKLTGSGSSNSRKEP